MIDRRGLTVIFGALTVTFATAPSAFAGESFATMVKGVAVCTSYNTDRSYDAEKRQYVSDVFTANAARDALNNAYRRFIQTKYHVQDEASCRNAGQGNMTESEARAYEKQQ